MRPSPRCRSQRDGRSRRRTPPSERRWTRSSAPSRPHLRRPRPPDDAEHGQEGQHPLSLLRLIDAAQGRRSEAGTIPRVSAPDIEAVLMHALRAAYPDDAALEDRALIEAQSSGSSFGPEASSCIRPQTQQAPSRSPGPCHLRAADARSWRVTTAASTVRPGKARRLSEARVIVSQRPAVGLRLPGSRQRTHVTGLPSR